MDYFRLVVIPGALKRDVSLIKVLFAASRTRHSYTEI